MQSRTKPLKRAGQEVRALKAVLDAQLELLDIHPAAAGWRFIRRGTQVGYHRDGAWKGVIDLAANRMRLPR
jgi:hypothetical protein